MPSLTPRANAREPMDTHERFLRADERLRAAEKAYATAQQELIHAQMEKQRATNDLLVELRARQTA